MAGAPGGVAERLDFVYMPSTDAAADLDRYVADFGAEPLFAIEAFETRVAAARVGQEGPLLVFAEHLTGESPVLIFRTADIEAVLAELAGRGIEPEARFEIPPGPCAILPGQGARVAIYERTRAVVEERLAGRFDFGRPG
jgi:hypothetical protein